MEKIKSYDELVKVIYQHFNIMISIKKNSNNKDIYLLEYPPYGGDDGSFLIIDSLSYLFTFCNTMLYNKFYNIENNIQLDLFEEK